MKEEKTLNKSGDKRGMKENNKQNFANNSSAASKAGKKGGPKKSVSSAITQAKGLTAGRNRRITPETQQYIRDEMFLPDASGVPFIHQFIHNFMVEAKTDPNSQAARILANTIFKEDMMATLDAELNRQMTKDTEFIAYRIRNTLYDKQQEVYDNRIDRTIQAICTRRAGKTELLARLMLRDAMTPQHHVLYINRTFDNAVKQAGKPLTDLLEKLDIKYSGSPGGGQVTFENGSDITFGGFYNKGEIDKFRGFKYSLVLVDEIGHLRNPKMLVQEVLEPAMMDYGKEAQLIYTGTPPRIKKSFAYELWHNPNIKHYHWSFMDNPYIPSKEDVIEKVCKDHGMSVDAPFIQREYFGNMEAFDEDAMIFRGYKKIDCLPQTTFDYGWIGVDWGYEDKAAVVSVLAKGKQAYIIKSWSEAKKSISDICNVIKEHLNNLKENYNIAHPVWVICDQNEKSAVYELYQTYKIQNAYCAYKYDKDLAIDQLAEWLRNDSMFVVNNKDNEAIIEDLDNMLWSRDEETDDILHEIADDEYHGNAAFALLYVSRQFDYDVMGMTPAKSAKSILEGRDD